MYYILIKTKISFFKIIYWKLKRCVLQDPQIKDFIRSDFWNQNLADSTANFSKYTINLIVIILLQEMADIWWLQPKKKVLKPPFLLLTQWYIMSVLNFKKPRIPSASLKFWSVIQ